MELPKPMKAVSGTMPDDEDGWAYEIKWDGMRVVAGVDGDVLRTESTRGLDVSPRFPELDALPGAVQGHRVVVDGEVVAFAGDRTDFSRLQQRMHVSHRAEAARRAATTPVVFVVFDLLHLDGMDTTSLAYLDRRRLLTELVEPSPAISVPAHREGDGQSLYDAAKERHLEGLMAKRVASRYEPGKRSPAWRKVKARRRQELVVGGWTPGEGGRSGHLGSLLVGFHGEGGLAFAGAVGTGFNAAELDRVQRLLDPLAVSEPPFATVVPRPVARTARWVRPDLVVEVEFAEWTPEGRLRHPSYLGQRLDADPARVVREP